MKNKKLLIGIIFAIVIVILIGIGVFFAIKNNKKDTIQSQNDNEVQTESNETITVNTNDGKDDKVDIINVNSKTRPYAVSVNNTPVAVKVQTGLNKAYLVYEIPTEGFTSRLLALYKDIDEDLVIGTIRSARHNFVDYALESDAIFVHYGWSHYAKDDERAGSIEYINGLFDSPFWRENPENLASEHTAYTSTDKIKQTVKNKGFKEESDNTVLLKYDTDDVDLSGKANAKVAKKVKIPYGSYPNVTSFVYDENAKVYYRKENNEYCVDHKTKEKVDTKNIIVQKIDYELCSDKKYWNLKTVGSGKGYYITNGYAVPITWKKDSRKAKTKYYYEDGKEIEVSDGRTYIELQTNNQELTIN